MKDRRDIARRRKATGNLSSVMNYIAPPRGCDYTAANEKLMQ
jgi:hypothetical protein